MQILVDYIKTTTKIKWPTKKHLTVNMLVAFETVVADIELVETCFTIDQPLFVSGSANETQVDERKQRRKLLLYIQTLTRTHAYTQLTIN